MEYTFEKLNDKISVCVSAEHTFGTDAFLLEKFAEVKRRETVCEFGTGCGIIAQLLFTDANPKKVYAVDIQEQAVRQLEIGVEKSGLCGKIIPICADLKDVSSVNSAPKKVMLDSQVDVVICNPPYKRAESGIVSAASAEAVARHEVSCDINDICQAAARVLKFGGRLCVCQRPERLADVIDAMRSCKIEPKRLRFAAKNEKSEPWLFMLEGRLGGAPFMRVMPSVFLSGKPNESSVLYGDCLRKENENDG